MSKTYRKNNDYKLPSKVAVAAYQRSGAGKHGGTPKQNHKRDRKASRQALRGGDYEH